MIEPGGIRGVASQASRIGSSFIDLAGRPAADVLEAGRTQLDELLPAYLREQRWFAGKGATIESARIGDVVPIPSPHEPGRSVGNLTMIDVTYADARAPERYAAVLKAFPEGSPRAAVDGKEVLTSFRAAEGDYVLADAITDRDLVEGLVHAMRGGHTVQGAGAAIAGEGAGALDDAIDGLGAITVEPLSMHTSNTSVRIGGRDGRQYALKLVRRHDGELDGKTPTRAIDVVKGAYLSNEAGYANTPAVLGSADHFGREGLPRTVSVLQPFVPNDGDGWADALVRASGTLKLTGDGAEPAAIAASIDDYGVAARNHGRRLGELHIALSSGPEGSEFRGVLQEAGAVEKRTSRLTEDARRASEQLRTAGYADDADKLVERLPERIDDVERAARELVPIEEIHTHGDFHLGQILRTGDDIQIIDLEGSPVLPIAERWQRTIALGDVARQRSSYEYAATQAVKDAVKADPTLDPAALRPIADQWAETAKDSFLRGWLDSTADRRFRHARSEFVPELREAELSNAVYETSYELGSRPDWVGTPLERMRRLLDGA